MNEEGINTQRWEVVEATATATRQASMAAFFALVERSTGPVTIGSQVSRTGMFRRGLTRVLGGSSSLEKASNFGYELRTGET